MTDTVTVATKSAWLSKINWLQIASASATLLTGNVLGLDAATQVKVMGGVSLIQSIGTVVLKTWFTPTVTPASVA